MGCEPLVIDGFKMAERGAGGTGPTQNEAGGYKALVMRQTGFNTPEDEFVFYFNNVPQTCDHPAAIPDPANLGTTSACADQDVYDFVFYAPLTYLEPNDGGITDGTAACEFGQQYKGCTVGGGGMVSTQCQASLEILGQDSTTIHVRLTGSSTLDGEYDPHICGTLSN